MSDWRDDKSWSDGCAPEIKRILGEHLIGEAPLYQDRHENTDLMVFSLAPVTIACRIRRDVYRAKYPHDITFRNDRPSGAKSERDKLIAGWGDFFFYGFAGDDRALTSWVMVDLDGFREQLIRKKEFPLRKSLLPNRDGSSTFIAIAAKSLMPGVIRAHSAGYWDHPPERQAANDG